MTRREGLGTVSAMSETPETLENFEGAVPDRPAFPVELYRAWRAPRFGRQNPEDLTNPVWEWLVYSRYNAWLAAQIFQEPSAFEAGPGWCFERFGQTVTVLPDGRTVHIGGEHEDYYDPDFQIYNDVVIEHPDGRVQILGYPEDAFPPTDFHTATLLPGRIVIIGSLGYLGRRSVGVTPVFALDLGSWSIARIATTGEAPGWIHRQEAMLAADGKSLRLTGGLVELSDDGNGIAENLDEWELDLELWIWRRLTRRNWPQFEVTLASGGLNHLFQFECELWSRRIPSLAVREVKIPGTDIEYPTLAQQIGGPPDLERYSRRYRPAIAHEVIEASEAEHGVHRIRVDGVIVRYVEDSFHIRMTVEGELPEAVVARLADELRDTLTALENAPCLLKRL